MPPANFIFNMMLIIAESRRNVNVLLRKYIALFKHIVNLRNLRTILYFMGQSDSVYFGGGIFFPDAFARKFDSGVF